MSLADTNCKHSIFDKEIYCPIIPPQDQGWGWGLQLNLVNLKSSGLEVLFQNNNSPN